MSPVSNLALVSHQPQLAPADLLRAPLRGGVRVGTAKEETSFAWIAGVALLHAAAIGWIMFAPQAQPQLPAIAFTVTLMEPSSAQNSVSSAASAPSVTVPQKQQEQVKQVVEKRIAPAVKPVQAAKPQVKPSPVTPKTQSMAAQEQSAVIAPITSSQLNAARENNPKPSYPPLSRRLGEQGRVLLSVAFDANGQAQQVSLKRSSGFDRLDNAAQEAARGWHIAAAQQQKLDIPFDFILE